MEDKKIIEEFIEEIDENNKKVIFKTSELINIIISNFTEVGNNIQLDYKDFGKKHSIPEIICKNTKVTNLKIYKIIYYKDVELLLNPKKFHFFNLDRIKTTYLIYNKSFVNKIKDSLNFKNPIIIMNRREYSYNMLDQLFYKFSAEFSIEEKEEEDYQSLFKNYKSSDINKGIDIKKGVDLTSNFQYYFKYPNPDDNFQYIFSIERCNFIQDKSTNKDKIIGYCGPMGIGKSTTLLALSKIVPNYCYLNIKALKESEDHIHVWKDRILIKEIVNTMLLINSTLEKFLELKDEINKCYDVWDAIEKTIDFFIKSKIKINFIFDQYKEKFDPKYHYLKKFKDILENDKDDIVYITISSSINDKDVRNSLIAQWVYESTDFIIYYIYINYLIDIKEIIEKDTSLTELQKNMIIKDFNSIPKFYYAIRSIKEEKKLNEYKDLQIKKIRNSIDEFFSENNNILLSEKLINLLNLRADFGNNLTKPNFKNLLNILPFKYFLFDIKNYVVDFLFPLVKDIFDDFLSNEICKFLKSPIPTLKEGTIGDILELNLISDLRNNNFCKFDQITKVDSIWDISEIKYTKPIADKNYILILQTNNEGRFVDFAILSNKENLLLYQCKKALKGLPKNPITKKIINEYSQHLKLKYKKYFCVDIKKIYLFYVTGITFFMKNNELNYRTWGGNEKENFKNIKNVAENAESELFFYDVVRRKLFYENGSKFEAVGNIIEHAINFSSCAFLYSENEIINDITKRKNELEAQNAKYLGNLMDRVIFDDDIQFFNSTKKAFLEKNYPLISRNKINYYITKPKYDFLNNKTMLGLKRKEETYILVNRKKEIKKGKKNLKKNKKESELTGSKSTKKGEEKKETQNGDANEGEREELEIEEEERVLMLVKDNELSEVKNIEVNFYENLDYCFVFNNEISL